MEEYYGDDLTRLQVMHTGILVDRVRCIPCLDQLIQQAISKGVDASDAFRLRYLAWGDTTIFDRLIFRKKLVCEECGARG
jgi:hypothetical protein